MRPQDFNEIERRLDEQLGAIGPLLDAPCPGQVRDRLGATVRLELDARWSADPRPAPETLDRVRRAVRAELEATARKPAQPPRRHLVYRLRTVAGVAAGLVLAIGLVRIVGTVWMARQARDSSVPTATPPSVVTGDRSDVVELFADAAERLWNEDTVISELSWEVQSLEEQLARQAGEDSVERMLDHIDEQLLELYEDWPAVG